MNLYLMRHAHAVERDEWPGPDSERPLIAKGRKAAAAVAEGLARQSPPVSRVITSPYMRALETARIVGRRLSVPVTTSDALAPGFDLARLDALLVEAGWTDGMLLVGHQPDLGEVSLALTGRASQSPPFKKAAVALIVAPDTPEPLARACGLVWLRTWREVAALASE